MAIYYKEEPTSFCSSSLSYSMMGISLKDKAIGLCEAATVIKYLFNSRYFILERVELWSSKTVLFLNSQHRQFYYIYTYNIYTLSPFIL